MTQGFADEARAIEERLRAGFTTLPIGFAGIGFVPPATGGYVTLSIVDGEGAQAAIATSRRRRRWVGIIQVDIWMPEKSGTRLGRAHADAIGSIFDNAQFSAGSSGTITTWTPSVIDGSSENGRQRTIVTIRFQRDII